jgi:bifunctional UDP-N-acetylglucosamine pyrophosphorylase/glucosamine-1-phosphate N-acetyltransferase
MLAIVLAGGMGKRMNSALPKVLHKVCGKPMILHILGQLGSMKQLEKTVVVVGYKKALVKKVLPKWIKTAVQKKMLGTGDAVKSARYHFEKYAGSILILCGDTPLIKAETLEKVLKTHEEEKNIATIVTTFVKDPTNYGRILRNKKGEPVGIVEEKSATAQEKKIKEINAGIYCFASKKLCYVLARIRKNKLKGEYYLTDAIEILRKKGLKIGTALAKDSSEVMGVDDLTRLKAAEKYLRGRNAGSKKL